MKQKNSTLFHVTGITSKTITFATKSNSQKQSSFKAMHFASKIKMMRISQHFNQMVIFLLLHSTLRNVIKILSQQVKHVWTKKSSSNTLKANKLRYIFWKSKLTTKISKILSRSPVDLNTIALSTSIRKAAIGWVCKLMNSTKIQGECKFLVKTIQNNF